MGLQSLIKIGGFKSYQIAVIVANQVMKVLLGRGLSLAANATLTRALSLFSGPVGWTIMTTWTALDLASPAYRVCLLYTYTSPRNISGSRMHSPA
ncbi:hypothetical protein ACISOQ_07765 [Campylobacter jejuni]